MVQQFGRQLDSAMISSGPEVADGTLDAEGRADEARADDDEASDTRTHVVRVPSSPSARVVRCCVPGRAGGNVPGQRRGGRAAPASHALHGALASRLRGGVRRGGGRARGDGPPMADGSRLSRRRRATVLAGRPPELPRAAHRTRHGSRSTREERRAGSHQGDLGGRR